MALLATAVVVLGAAACGAPEPADQGASGPRDAAAEQRWRDDLAGMRERGRLRVLVQRRPESWLPRSGSPLESERDRVRALAADLGLEAEFVAVEQFGDLIPALLDGRGDLVAENLTVTPARQQKLAFSAPIALVHDQVVARADETGLRRLADLAGRTLVVQRSSSFWETAQTLARRHPTLAVEAADERLGVDGLLDAVAEGRFDLTLMDSNVMDAALTWRDDLQVALELAEPRMIAWAMRPDAPALRSAVDGFLASSGRASEGREIHTDDLPGIRKRGVLRVLTRNNATTYFITRGRLVGFEYDLVRRFTRQLGLRPVFVVPPSRDLLFDWLREGKGDVIAAGITADRDVAKREGVRFSRNYHSVRETVVARSGEPAPRSVDELAGRSFWVRPSSAYWRTLERLRGRGVPIDLKAAPEELETEEIIARVAAGDYDLTLADSHILGVALSWRDDVQRAFEMEGERRHGWVVRADADELLAAIDGFFDREYRGTFYNVTHEKYFGNPRSMRRRLVSRPRQAGWLSPFDDLARKHSRPRGFDWRLVVAQMYEESRFDPAARSFAGARGLLQVMPRTASELGYTTPLDDPETGIEAGLDYLAWVRDRFESRLPAPDQTWFTLAAYNVGYGHVSDARRIARERGLDPDRWFDHVEAAMLLKERPEVYRKTRFGYARGGEPVAYVRNIRDRYDAYLQAHAGGN